MVTHVLLKKAPDGPHPYPHASAQRTQGLPASSLLPVSPLSAILAIETIIL